MAPASRGFQVLVKPIGALCNLRCAYCYYLAKGPLQAPGTPSRMTDDLLESYIVQHIEACPDEVIRFSWHGGEPTLLDLPFFQRVVALQRRHKPAGKRIDNGMQTNGTRLDDAWAHFLAEEYFSVGLSLDGPRSKHDLYRTSKDGRSSFDETLRGFDILRRHGVAVDILCVVHAGNVEASSEVYGFFKALKAPYVTFLPLVEPHPNTPSLVSKRSVPPAAWGEFLCAAFDEWAAGDIGRIKIQIFEEASRTAFGQDHSLCIFRPVCGDIPVVEHNGDFYSCDHYVDAEHHLGNIGETPLSELIDSPAQRAFGLAKRNSLPRVCLACDVLAMCNGECPKNRILTAPDGESGLNYLCSGYKRFFNHCRPFVKAVAAEWRRQTAMAGKKAEAEGRPGRKAPTPERNARCPCGSRRKFKKCCGA